jgi:hypothetical protein
VKKRVGLIVVGLVLALVALTGCTSSNAIPTSWFHSTSGGAVYITWTDAKGGIKGTVREALLPPNVPKGYTTRLTTSRLSFVGTISKGKIVLHLVEGTLKATNRGTVSSTKLSIDNGANLILRPGTSQQYAAALAKLKKAGAARSKG